MSAPTVDVPDARLEQRPARRRSASTSAATVDQVRGGDIGSLPALLGLLVLVIVFSIAAAGFFSAATSPTCSPRPPRSP